MSRNVSPAVDLMPARPLSFVVCASTLHPSYCQVNWPSLQDLYRLLIFKDAINSFWAKIRKSQFWTNFGRKVSENGDFRFIHSLSSEHFTYMATRQLSGGTTVNDLGHISRSLGSFTSNFSKTVCDTAKVAIG